MSKIIDFLKVQCGDPDKGGFEAPLTFDGLVELFQSYDLMLADEHGGLPEVLELDGERLDLEVERKTIKEKLGI